MGARDLIINVKPNQVDVALLEDNSLIELHHDKQEVTFEVGNIYLGKTKRVMPGLNAAFISVGSKRDAFLHYTDLGPQISSFQNFTNKVKNGSITSYELADVRRLKDIDKKGNIKSVLKRDQQVVVQVIKEPISTKGPRISSDVSFAGRYLVLTLFSDEISISKKIVDRDERKRLERLIGSIRPKGFGVVVRTAARGKGVAELHSDLQLLVENWGSVVEEIKTAKPADKLFVEEDRSSTLLRDILNDSFNSIVTNDKSNYIELKRYVKKIAPDKEKLVTLYTGGTPIFDQFHVTKQIKSLFGRTVNLTGGAYLVIEHTEAMTVIDVNSGPKAGKESSAESSVQRVNIEAAKEIARQIRLRDIGGIIIVDFIDVKGRDERSDIHSTVKDAMATDTARHTILPLTRFCLLQMTRQRVRPPIEIETEENCPTCNGKGKVAATLLLMDKVEADISYLLNEMNYKSITIQLHPFIAAYLTKGIYSKRLKWFMTFKKWITIRTDASYNLTEYKFFNAKQEEIVL